MKGKRDPQCDYDPLLGLAILGARRSLYVSLSEKVGIPQPERYWRSHEAIGAFMGLSDHAIQLIERRALRKLRIALIYRRSQLGEDFSDAIRIYENKNLQAY